MGSWVFNRRGSLARRSVGHWCGHHGGCLLDFVCLDCVKCDLWLGGFRYGGWVFVGCGMGGRFVVVVVGWWVVGFVWWVCGWWIYGGYW